MHPDAAIVFFFVREMQDAMCMHRQCEMWCRPEIDENTLSVKCKIGIFQAEQAEGGREEGGGNRSGEAGEGEPNLVARV